MSRLRDELRLVPLLARAIAAVCYLFLALFLLLVVGRDRDTAAWPPLLWALVSVVMPVPIAIYVLLIGYIYSDAKRRGMRHVLWTWLAALVPNAVGIVLYFVLRDPVAPQPCPQCGTPARAGFAFCTQCGASLTRACPACRRAAEPVWSHCAFCGAKLS